MGRIEQYWEDIIVYSVEFFTLSGDDVPRQCRKILVFPCEVTKEDVFHLLPIYFHQVSKVLHVDEISEGLLLKKELS